MPEYRVVRTIYDHFFDFENRAPLFLERGFDMVGTAFPPVLCSVAWVWHVCPSFRQTGEKAAKRKTTTYWGMAKHSIVQ